MNIRVARESDCDTIYNLGISTPELRVSAQEPFMTREELLEAIAHPDSVFLLAHEKDAIIGFIYARVGDLGIYSMERWACIVYVAVAANHRRSGVAKQLYEACEKLLQTRKVTNLYCWTNIESTGIVPFFQKRGFIPGKTCMWMDKKL